MARLGNDRNIALTPPWRVGPFRRASRLRRSLGFCAMLRCSSSDGDGATTLHQNTHLSMPLKERGFAGRGLILWGIGPCDARVQRGL